MNGKFCKWCSREGTDSCPENTFTAPLRFCPVEKQSGDFEDAANFEARVAEGLTRTFYYFDDHSGEPDVNSKRVRFLRLKMARISVELDEEEMDR